MSAQWEGEQDEEKSAIEAIPANVAILDGAGVILRTNQAWKAFARANNADLARVSAGVNYLQVCDAARGEDAEQAHRFADKVRAIIRGEGKAFAMDYPCHSPDTKRWFTGYVGSFFQGDEIRLLIAHVNISKHVIDLEALREASRAKDQFLAVLSHELRTPLTPVLAIVTAMRQDEDIPLEVRTELAVVQHNVELEARLIDDLLDITRLAHGKFALYPQTVDVHACIREVIEICENELRTKHLALRIGFQAHRHHVEADPARLRQVFWNLLSNAMKFTPTGGDISSSSRNSDEHVVIAVADTGIGIKPEMLSRIFDPFEQGEQSRTRRFGGLGLGLGIAKALVDLHHGRIAVQSEGEGRGATFTVDLATVAEVSFAPPEPAPKQSPRSLRILLLEDNLDTLRVVSKILQRWGYVVSEAACVADAIRIATKDTFDLIISDLALPDGSGTEVMERLKPLGVHGLAMSGYGGEEDVRRAYVAGFRECLLKPVTSTGLREAIERAAS